MLLTQALQSRVGRRLFASFALATLIPIIVLAGYAYSKVSHALTESTNQHLRQESKLIGMMIVDRLNNEAEALRTLSNVPLDDIDPSWLQLSGFSHVRPATESIRSSISSEQALQLAQGRVVLLSGVPDETHLMMLIKSKRNQQVLFAELNTRSWWQDEILPEDFCILLRSGHPLYCSPSLAGVATTLQSSLSEDSNIGNFTIDRAAPKLVAGYWDVSLDAQYAMPGFVFVVAEKNQAAMSTLSEFKLFFLALALLAVSSAAWLAIRLIRRQLLPLNQLMEGTKRLADGNFESPIVHASDDEFGQLASSFNSMSDSLNRKFHILKKLDELDHAILESTDLVTLFRTFFNKLSLSLPVDLVVIVHRSGAGEFVPYTADEPLLHAFGTGDSAHLCENLFNRVHESPNGFLDFSEINQEMCLRATPVSQMQQALILPIEMNRQVIGLLVLGFCRRHKISEDTIQTARIFSERLSVAAEKLDADQRLYHQAHHDALTHLPNRILLAERTEQAIQRSDRNSTVTALLLADLDRFKHINDSLGHEAGDELLLVCAQRLQENLRVSDTVARYGGDEFILLLPDLEKTTAIDDILFVINKLKHVFQEPIDLLGRSVLIEFSIGVALYPDDASGFNDLLRMADTAMYVAKKSMDKDFTFYSQGMNRDVRHRFELMQELRTAIDQNEMVLFYQPKVEAQTGKIVGAEALVRWQSPTRGLLMPGSFIPLLDQMGMGHVLGEWVLAEACAQMHSWDQRAFPMITVSINLSPSQFLDESLCQKVQACISTHGISSSRLEIEILEDTAVDGDAVVQNNLSALRQMGVNIALDDFGTGYSSLVHLINVPANVLKLDRSFISDIATNFRQQSIVEHIIALAKTLDFQVVAEGIEEQSQAEWLRDSGCDLFQGYLYSRPVPASSFEHMLQSQENSGI
jgi:diguanylate cyclase (GGDEF)-like protein